MFASAQQNEDSTSEPHRLTRREWCGVALAGAAAVHCCNRPLGTCTAAAAQPKFEGTHRVGVSLAGAEFGHERRTFSNQRPGTFGKDYTYPTRDTIRYFTSKGLGLFRVPFRWERIQPALDGELDPQELLRLKRTVADITDCGGLVVLDVHNYGRYHLHREAAARPVVIDERIDGEVPVRREHLADLWRKLATEFSSSDGFLGYGVMNEPHDMGASDWKKISQAAVNAIREVDRDRYVIVAGDGWSNAHRWEYVNGRRAWIEDPSEHCVYEAHCYFDASAAGKYHLSFEKELLRDPFIHRRGVKRITPFIDWCGKNRVPGFVGEFGIPAADPGWHKVLANFLTAVKAVEFPACYWAAGEWWGDYPMSIQPRKNGDDAPQLATLKEFGV